MAVQQAVIFVKEKIPQTINSVISVKKSIYKASIGWIREICPSYCKEEEDLSKLELKFSVIG